MKRATFKIIRVDGTESIHEGGPRLTREISRLLGCDSLDMVKQQSLPGYLLVMQYEINEAIAGWMKNKAGRNSSLQEIVQVVATGVACLDFYGIDGNALSTNDITEAELRRERLERSNRRFGVEA